MRLFVSLLAAFAMTSSLTAKAASAAQSLDQIRYALFKNPQADVEEDLRIHASFGEHQAMRLLGDLLVEKGLAAEREAIELFQRAFADGTGKLMHSHRWPDWFNGHPITIGDIRPTFSKP